MGPKSKASKHGWEGCNICRRILPATDVSKHVDWHSGKHHGPDSASKKTTSKSVNGFILNGILHCTANQRQRIGEDLARIPASYVDDFVLICPSTMALCELTIGFPVLVWSSPSRYVIQTAWPAKDGLRLTELGISSRTLTLLRAKNGETLHVQKLSTNQQSLAGEVLFNTSENKSFFSSKSFEEFFCYFYDNKPLIVGCLLDGHFYGQHFTLSVIEIDGVDKTVVERRKTEPNFDVDTSSVSEVFGHLSLNESTNIGDESFCNVIESADAETMNNKTSFALSSPSTSQNKTSFSFCSEKATSTPEKISVSTLCECYKTRPASAKSAFLVHSKTRVRIVSTFDGHTSSNIALLPNDDDDDRKHLITFDDIGGLKKQLEEINKLLFMSKSRLKLFSSCGFCLPRGILLFGPPGTGKTLIGKAIATKMGNRFIPVNLPEIYSKFVGETESKLQQIFTDAVARAPSVIFIDEIDSLFSRRSNPNALQDERLLSTFLMLLDDLPVDPNKRVVVIAATNRVDQLSSAVRRPGRFDLEIEVGIPTAVDRQDILRKLLKNVCHCVDDEAIESVAFVTHGYVGADLAALCMQAGLRALQRAELKKSRDEDSELKVNDLVMSVDDLKEAIRDLKPSVVREVFIEVPKVHWDDIGGLDDLKLKLKHSVEWPLKHPDAFQRLGIVPPKGVLMYGPPGCSKTMIAKAVATESHLNFIAIKGPELFSKWVGESERAVREVFRKARAAAPSVVFFDEIDALASERGISSGSSQVGDRVLAQLLSEIDGLEKLQGVTILAATNRPDMIDKALLRPGRLDRIVYVPLPDKETRKAIFQIQLRRIPAAGNVEVDNLADVTEGYSGAEIVAVCQEAALIAMEENLEAIEVTRQHFDSSLKIVKPRTSTEMIKFYEDYCKQGHCKLP